MAYTVHMRILRNGNDVFCTSSDDAQNSHLEHDIDIDEVTVRRRTQARVQELDGSEGVRYIW